MNLSLLLQNNLMTLMHLKSQLLLSFMNSMNGRH